MDYVRILEHALLQALKEMTAASPFVELSGYETHLSKLSLLANKTTFFPQNVLSFLEQWASSKTSPFCAILGEYGMGKTTACTWFSRRLLEKRPDYPALPIPIYLDLRALPQKSLCDTLSLSEMIEIILKHSLFKDPSVHHLIDPKTIIKLVQEGEALAIFDGLDEVLVHLSTSLGQNFTRKLMSILPASNFKKKKGAYSQVLLSCRTHFFRTLREQKTHFTQEDRGGIRPEDFLAIELLPFNESQIQQYFAQTLPEFSSETLFALIRSVHNLSELTERPYTLSLIPEIIPYIEQWRQENRLITSATIYNRVVQSWFERDSGKHTLTLEHKRRLMEELAAALWQSGEKNWSVIRLEQWLVQFLHTHPSIVERYTVEQQISFSSLLLEIIKEDVRTATFLVRAGEDSFRFAHTSLQEFFLASHLFRAVLEHNQSAWDLPLVNQEILHFLGQLLAEQHPAVDLSLFTKVHSDYQPRISEQVFFYLLFAYNHSYPAIPIEGMCLKGAELKECRIIGQANKLLPAQGLKLQQANLEGSYLRYLDLNYADFSEANLKDSELLNNQIQFANFSSTNFDGAIFRESTLEASNFEDSKFNRTRWMECNFNQVTYFNTQSNSGNYFFDCQPEQFSNTNTAVSSNQPDTDTTHHNDITQCVFSPDGQFIASSSYDKTIRIWDTQTGQCIRLLSGHQDRIRNCAFSPHQLQLISIADDKTLRLWDIQSGECLKIFTGHGERAKGCAFSPDGIHIASASKDQTLRIWDIATGECVRVFKGHTDTLRGCAFSPDGNWIVSSSEDTTLRIWNMNSGLCNHILKGHQRWVQGCTFSSDGAFVLSSSGDKTLRLWNTATGACVQTFIGHDGPIKSCTFLGDQSKILSASYDKSLRIWDSTTGKCIKTLHGHTGEVRACTYSSALHLIASASADCTIRLWDPDTGECLKILGELNPMSTGF